MTCWRLLLVAAAALALPASAGPLEKNLELLRARAAASRPAARPARPRPTGRVARPRPRVMRVVRAPAAQNRFVSYSRERFGARARTGDLIVRTEGSEGPTHVYVRQRLLSSEGNGQARVPDLAPGKHPVMVWAPEARKRKTFWVMVQPGRVAELQASL